MDELILKTTPPLIENMSNQIGVCFLYHLLGILSSISSGLATLCLSVEIDQEEAGEEGTEKDSEVGTELNLE
jgi:hypothetical protein